MKHLLAGGCGLVYLLMRRWLGGFKTTTATFAKTSATTFVTHSRFCRRHYKVVLSAVVLEVTMGIVTVHLVFADRNCAVEPPDTLSSDGAGAQ
jgi:predicted anti-sigma-YlaC factor YlaD